jgi:hypothetical protein
MPEPVGSICGQLYESADSVYLPKIWPTLQNVIMYVDTNTFGMNTILRLASRSSVARGILRRGVRLGTALARWIGASAGGVGYGIEDATGIVACYAITATENSFLTAVAPAVLAAKSMVEDTFRERGLIMPDRYVEPTELFAYLKAAGIAVQKMD